MYPVYIQCTDLTILEYEHRTSQSLSFKIFKAWCPPLCCPCFTCNKHYCNRPWPFHSFWLDSKIIRFWHLLRDRPFNLKGGGGGGGYGFLFRSEFFFRTTQELEYLFFCRAKCEIFFLHQIQNIFFSNIGNQNIFKKKNHNPPPSS
jgi:hypothetical protein